MNVQLKKERLEWASEQNALQQQNAELKVCVSLSCRNAIYVVGICDKKLFVCTYVYLLGCE